MQANIRYARQGCHVTIPASAGYREASYFWQGDRESAEASVRTTLNARRERDADKALVDLYVEAALAGPAVLAAVTGLPCNPVNAKTPVDAEQRALFARMGALPPTKLGAVVDAKSSQQIFGVPTEIDRTVGRRAPQRAAAATTRSPAMAPAPVDPEAEALLKRMGARASGGNGVRVVGTEQQFGVSK
jgi:hypothetical protein